MSLFIYNKIYSFEGVALMTEIIRQSWPILILLVVFYFLTFMPEQKRRKAYLELIGSLKTGDIVTTRGGMVGTIEVISEDRMILVTGPDAVRIEMTRSSVANVVRKDIDQEA